MIHFNRLIAKDTFSYTTLDFTFKTGLTSISGLNGSSKSSIFMALQAGLFNKCAKGCKIDGINNIVTGKPFEITVYFTKGYDEYIVCNSRKEGKITVTCNGKDISLKRIPENLALISEILDTDFATFVDLTYQSKDSSLSLLETSTDRARKEFISRILKLDEIDAQQARMKEKEKDLAGKNGKIASLNTQISLLDSSLGSLMLEGGECPVNHLEEELLGYNTEAERLKSEITRLTNEVKIVEAEVAAWKSERALRTKLAELQSSIDTTYSGNIERKQEQVLHVSQLLNKCQSEINSERDLLKQLEKYKLLQGKIDAAIVLMSDMFTPEMTYEECKSQKEKISNAWKTRQGSLDSSVKELIKFETAQAKGECPTCGSHADVSAQIKSLQEVVQKDTEFITKCTTSYKKYEGWIKQWEECNKASAELAKLRAEAATAPKGDINETTLALESLLGLQQELVGQEKEAKQDLTNANVQEKLRLQILGLQATITKESDCPYSVKYEDNLLMELSYARSQLKDLQAEKILATSISLEEKKTHNAKVRATIELNKQITANNQKIILQADQFKKELAECENKLGLLKTWQGILGSKGYRVARIRKFVSSLNHLMDKYTKMLSGGRIKCNFFINELGEVEYKITDDAKEMEFDLWSNGEKYRIIVMCRFALLELLESMGSMSYNILALDEVFSGLDQEGKDGLFVVLPYLRAFNKSIATIAHEDLVLDLNYDYQVKAVKLQDGTTEVGYV